MKYYEKIIENPDAALDEIAARRGFTRDQMAQRITNIRNAAGDQLHITLSQAQHFFDEGVPLIGDVRAHVDSCVYCQALVDSVQPVAVDVAVRKAEEAVFRSVTRRSSTFRERALERLGGIGANLFRPRLAFAAVAVVFLGIGISLKPMLESNDNKSLTPSLHDALLVPSDDSNNSHASSEDYKRVREAFIEGQPAVGYQRLTAVLKQAGLSEQGLAPVKRLKSAVEQPIPEEARAAVLAGVLDRGRPVDLAKIRDIEQAENAMTRLAQIGDHPRALIALQAYLAESKAPEALRVSYGANVDTLARAAAQGAVDTSVVVGAASSAETKTISDAVAPSRGSRAEPVEARRATLAERAAISRESSAVTGDRRRETSSDRPVSGRVP